MLIFCDFIQVCVFTTKHHLKLVKIVMSKSYFQNTFTRHTKTILFFLSFRRDV